jgi:hypothetical protein
MVDKDSLAGVERQRRVRRRFEEVVEARGRRDHMMMKRREMPLAVHAEAQLLPGTATMPDGAVHLRPRQG